jgi:uncharacterized RDD family membrane protein YckC
MRYHTKKPGAWMWTPYATDSLEVDLATGKIGSDWRIRREGESHNYTPQELIAAEKASRERIVAEMHAARMSVDEGPLHYGGFWVRFAAFWLDFLVMLPLTAVVFWASQRYRLFDVYYFAPGTLIGLFYSVYLVRRFGGTPGNLIMSLRIRKVTGDPVGYREAVLRYAPEFLLGTLMGIALLQASFRMTDAEFHALSFMERSQRLMQIAPAWLKPLQIIQNIWIWSEFIVLLTNRKRRALHDFIAGTVVVFTERPNHADGPAREPGL